MGMRKLMVALLSAPIRAYRAVISPMMPPVCRFTPSCSAYALEALHQHGPVTGLWLAVRRIARCHPIAWLGGSSGFDPVPFSKRHPNQRHISP
jgi:putative membrane protein insertion efficiency factor